MGSFLIQNQNIQFIISASFGASFAMGLSGFMGAYMAEKAERTKHLKDLETAMFGDLKNSILHKASKVASIWIAFVDGISPAVVAILIIIPLILSARTPILTFQIALYLSITIAFVILFMLGIFLGRISQENLLLHGLKMVSIGGLLALFFLVLQAIV